MFVTGQTAFHALVTLGQIKSRESVLITAAAGGVGTCAVQIARLLGAKVVAAAGSEAFYIEIDSAAQQLRRLAPTISMRGL